MVDDCIKNAVWIADTKQVQAMSIFDSRKREMPYRRQRQFRLSPFSLAKLVRNKLNDESCNGTASVLGGAFAE